MTERLFDPEPYTVAKIAPTNGHTGTTALGQAAEMILCGELLFRGHSVYRPVSDHEGIDLIVDNRLAVQVKSSVDHYLSGFTLRTGSRRAAVIAISAAVGVVAMLDWPTRSWYFVPREVIGSRQNFRARADSRLSAGRANAEWREAWHLFDPAVAA